MKAARTQTDNVIDFSAKLKFDGEVALKNRIENFIRGIKGPRQNLVTTAQIVQWFRATPEDFVHARLNDLVAEGRVRCVPRSLNSTRRAKGVCVYEVAG